MKFFNFFKKRKQSEEAPEIKESSQYSRSAAENFFPLAGSDTQYTITDKYHDKTFVLDIHYDFKDSSLMPMEELLTHDYKDDFYKVTVSLNNQNKKAEIRCSFSSEVYQKDHKEIIGKADVQLALYDKLRRLRQDPSDPVTQQQAYLVSALLRLVHDEIWLSPLLKNKQDVMRQKSQLKETYERIKKQKEDYRRQQKAQAGKPKKQSIFSYIQGLMKQNMADK